jgi:alpha-beta hydrolase superfamily lysophospholipase
VSTHTDFAAPEGLRTRGTLVVVPGRGETRTTYTRFGTRLSADAYHVRVVDPPRLDQPDTLEQLAEVLAAAVTLPRPLVLVGADAGAAAVAALVAQGGTPADAVVLAGLPGHAAAVTGDWDSELDVRTSCAVHREVLTGDAERGALSTALPDDLLDTAYGITADLPLLVLVGDADPLADREALARTVKSLPAARLSVVHGAHHDVLNDRQHRSVAAEVVSFLETLGNELVPVITVESSAW